MQTTGPLIDAEIVSIFFGGGTPSILSIDLWQRIYTGIIKKLNRTIDCEWTIECNPESLHQDTLALWHELGVNRITVGIQSLNNRELNYLGRPHTAENALAIMQVPELRRFHSVGVDCIYGFEPQTVDSVVSTISQLTQLPAITHVSAYELNLSPHSRLGKHCSLIPQKNEDEAVLITQTVWGLLSAKGFIQYEISNFARPGYECRHNQVYWDHKPYLGLGPAAHSYLHPRRFANTASVADYGQMVMAGKPATTFSEILDGVAIGREMIFLGLRRSAGLDCLQFEKATGMGFDEQQRHRILAELQDRSLIHNSGSRWFLSPAGLLLCDAITHQLSNTL